MVHDDAEAEDVGSVVVGLLLNDFWAQVKWRTDLPRLHVLLLIDHGALAQVAELDFPVLGDQDVQRLQIPMNYIV